ncbi:response regulator transcription factor [Aidingimonas halophila]|uniref:Transcriptional regulator, LuxR family n=1 Tax=Aidingimonas halophila TaxID=574349 RepID=A0A1H3HBE0_9GAMM|nr:response regulator transcription factor [Aidingimonas halophila]GHC36325.1 hypothetical protein GCM10008094_31900 [Aidingimonas halophila]SDY12792.1 transcriptional regulator, LuxR family [Aidingimonas halophila]
MTHHLFVTQGNSDIPRWREAFPLARDCRPAMARAQAGKDDHVWVMSNVDDWGVLVNNLSRRGAIVAVLSYTPDSEEALQALACGARGYAHALSSPESLRQIQLVISNQGIWVLPELMAKVVGSTFRALGGESRVHEDTLAALTARERAVALSVAAGNSNKRVARELDITERTVKAHLGAVFRKLQVRDRMQLILMLSRQPVTEDLERDD